MQNCKIKNFKKTKIETIDFKPRINCGQKEKYRINLPEDGGKTR